MSSKQPDSNNHTQESPFNDFDLDINATNLISSAPRRRQAKLIAQLEVKLGEQQHITLGSFTEASPPKGFSIELTPDPNPAGSVVTEITSLGTAKRYKLVLHIANYGTRAVSAKIWQL
ncbi:MAG: hypothetical protein ABWY71_03130 [Candidatus Saccharimonadales bacterium]